MAAVTAAAVATVGAGYMQAQGAKSAARTQAAATRDAARMADPFHASRGYYGDMLNRLFGAGQGGYATTSYAAPARSSINLSPKARTMGFGSAVGWTGAAGRSVRGSVGSNYTTNVAPSTEEVTSMFEAFSPNYKFVRKQGIDAITRAGAAQGEIGSGALGTALAEYATNLASSEFDKYVNWLGQFSGATSGNMGAAAQVTAQGGAQQAKHIQDKYAGYGTMFQGATSLFSGLGTSSMASIPSSSGAYTSSGGLPLDLGSSGTMFM